MLLGSASGRSRSRGALLRCAITPDLRRKNGPSFTALGWECQSKRKACDRRKGKCSGHTGAQDFRHHDGRSIDLGSAWLLGKRRPQVEEAVGRRNLRSSLRPKPAGRSSPAAQSDESERPFRRIRTPGSRSAGRWNLYPRRPPGSSGASSRHFALYRTRRTTSSWGQLWVAAVGRRRLATSGRPRRGTRRGRPRNDSEGRPGGTRRPLASRYLGLGEDMDSRGGLWPAPGSTISPGHDPR